ncbi:MAG: Omp28-related outer membrane protein, partial [Bacteroidales bacterium]|nr:Omp28-related outer membrane protein [Bacteroidales bacterium]
MTKSLMFLLTVSCVSLGWAQETTSLGYCAGEIADQAKVSVEGKCWVEAAICLTPEMLSPYNGKSITGLRGALVSKTNLDSLRLWLRTDLNEGNLQSATLTTKTDIKIKKGWNEVTLDSPYVIDASAPLYVGISYHQKAAANALSIVGSGLDNAFWAKMGDEAQWEDWSSQGILSIEALVESKLPDYDLALLSATCPSGGDASQTTFHVTVANTGTQNIEGFTLLTTSADRGYSYENHFDIPLASGEKTTIDYTIPISKENRGTQHQIEIVSLDNAQDAIAPNNTIAVKNTLNKKVLIEEFTTERCGNCPNAQIELHQVVEEKFSDDVVILCHHAGYYTDFLTQQCDEDFADYFSVGGAPSFMFDRYVFSGYSGPVMFVDGNKFYEDHINECLGHEAHTSISISQSFDESAGMLSVEISGGRNQVIGRNAARLWVYVVENNVEQKRQSSAYDGFMHQHVIRATTDSSWGEEISWNVNAFTHSYEFAIDPEWKKADLQIIAVVGNYDANNTSESAVDNVESVPFNSTASIASIATDDPISEIQYFTLQGMPISKHSLRPGIYIKKT